MPKQIATLTIQAEEELDAVLLGLCMVLQQDDSECFEAAEGVLNRIVAALPKPGHVGRRPLQRQRNANGTVAEVYLAVHNELRLHIAYHDKKGFDTKRTIWPIEFYDDGQNEDFILAWCETRNDFRNFRTDRIQSLETMDRYPVRRQLLLARWRGQQTDEFY